LAIHLTFAAKGVIPPRYRALYVLFACVALFVSLEEVSYGQHIFGWQSPKFFVQQNTKHEVNLHNLYEDRLSDILRQVANIVFPAICIALPLAAFAQRKQDDPRHWAFFLLPKFELVTIALIAQATPPLDRLSKSLVGVSMLVRAGELQELLWSIAIVMYAWTVHQRVFLQHASSRIGAMGSSQPGPTYLKKGILTQ
jgi:hypothetical protein